jgi:hypothetical protein
LSISSSCSSLQHRLHAPVVIWLSWNKQRWKIGKNISWYSSWYSFISLLPAVGQRSS